MPVKKVFATPEEANDYIEELRRRKRERAKFFMKTKLKRIQKNINNF